MTGEVIKYIFADILMIFYILQILAVLRGYAIYLEISAESVGRVPFAPAPFSIMMENRIRKSLGIKSPRGISEPESVTVTAEEIRDFIETITQGE